MLKFRQQFHLSITQKHQSPGDSLVQMILGVYFATTFFRAWCVYMVLCLCRNIHATYPLKVAIDSIETATISESSSIWETVLGPKLLGNGSGRGSRDSQNQQVVKQPPSRQGADRAGAHANASRHFDICSAGPRLREGPLLGVRTNLSPEFAFDTGTRGEGP